MAVFKRSNIAGSHSLFRMTLWYDILKQRYTLFLMLTVIDYGYRLRLPELP